MHIAYLINPISRSLLIDNDYSSADQWLVGKMMTLRTHGAQKCPLAGALMWSECDWLLNVSHELLFRCAISTIIH
jgi:hypothetical protein